MAKLDPNVLAHLEWLGFVRPNGLVVSAPALARAGAILDRRDVDGQRLLQACVHERTFDPAAGSVAYLPDFPAFARAVLGWSFSPKGYAGTAESPIPPELEAAVADSPDPLRPDFAVRERDPKDNAPPWQLLVAVHDPDVDLDRAAHAKGQPDASAHSRMERLLRQTGVPVGVIFNGRLLRLVSAPRGESSGWLDFRVADMAQTAGRPIVAALRLLLSEQRLLALPRAERLAALLDDSRKFQNEVSERLAEQVLHALYALLRGFQSAHDASGHQLLHQTLANDPDQVYRALLTVILRLVFLLFAEERDLLPEDETFLRYYSLAGLYDRLREDAALYPDTMDQRFGAWAQLVVLFRMIHDGAVSGAMHLPRRHGALFDPDRFPFLEGRALARQTHERLDIPLVPDGAIHRALDQLLVLGGERISYRALDVEQIGSVYETMMGFSLSTAAGPSVAIRAQAKHGAPTTINLDALLDQPAASRDKWIFDHTARKLPESTKRALRAATTQADLHAALRTVIDDAATPDIVPPGAMILQPSAERRRSGSHYTPRALTEPIVRTTLEPILARLRGPDNRPPTPAQILDLKICDPAMGSAAFLVETCRQLGDALIEAWHAHDQTPTLPPDEDEVVYARRLIAARCLYGVDRNPVAVDLAKVSLWLVTLAKDHPLTFVDHALRHGDSLVGLDLDQITAFHWDARRQALTTGLEAQRIREHVAQAAALRRRIREADDTVPDWELADLWREAQHALSQVRLYGDLAVSAFFEGDKPKEREARRLQYAEAILGEEAEKHRGRLADLRDADPPLAPFHWQVEFPEVFDRDNPGFDAMVGNPPFAGKNTLINSNVANYSDWLLLVHEESDGNADLVAHFFRRAFNLLRHDGAFGLIATNTISQGDTRASGLRWICNHGGEIFATKKRYKWPGVAAAVIVSVVHVVRGTFTGRRLLDLREVPIITAFLFHAGGHDDPGRLVANAGKSFQGSIVLGMGFTFDDTDTKGVATSLAEMQRLIDEDHRQPPQPNNRDVIFPYIGGEEVNSSPTHAHHRYVINFGERSEEECRRDWPALMAIVEAKVKPERTNKDAKKYPRMVHEWWKYWNARPDLLATIAGLERVLFHGFTCQHLEFAFLPKGMVYAGPHNVFPLPSFAAFCALQSRPHETWARFFGSSLEDRLRYTPSDCFETFPFPPSWDTDPVLEAAGKAYYEYRADLMVRNDEGLTKTYNRFHDPYENSADIARLRELHAAMDRAVLEAYGWSDIPTACEFLLDYEIDEEEWGDKKKPWRLRWPDEVRDEVLARLLALNAKRAREEARAGAGAGKRAGGRGQRAAQGALL